MPNGRRWNVSYPRKFTAAGIIAVGLFIGSAGGGLQSWSVLALGIALTVLAASLIIISAVRAGARSYIRGTAHVLDVTDPPANVPFARCELQVVVEAEALAPVKVKIHDDRAPVAKWPEIGDTLPVRVAVEDPHHVRILWGEIRTHAERAAEEEAFQAHVQRIVEAELATGGEPAGDEGTGAATSGTGDDTTAVPRPRPRPRPSPRPRRPDAVATTAGTATAAPSEAREDEEVAVHDVMPIEGASAVLGRPDEAGVGPDEAGAGTPTEAEAEAAAAEAAEGDRDQGADGSAR